VMQVVLVSSSVGTGVHQPIALEYEERSIVG